MRLQSKLFTFTVVLSATFCLHASLLALQTETTADGTQANGAVEDRAQAAGSAQENSGHEDVAGVDAAAYQRTVSGAVDFLLNKGRDPVDGSFSKHHGPAVTAMCTTALMKHGLPLEHEAVISGLAFLEQFIQEDGGIYAEGSSLRNYETSVAIMCFAQANVDGRYDVRIQNAVGFLKGIQWDEGEGVKPDSSFYGGLGYGKHKRPDLSNTSFFVDAMIAAGEDPDSEAMQKAKTFLSRGQNLQSPHNDQEFVQNINADDEGGMIYTPVGPESKATWDEDTANEPANGVDGESVETVDGTAGGAVESGVVEATGGDESVDREPADDIDGEDIGSAPEQQQAVGGLRSYASMTYAGLKSFLYAGVDKDDIRVKSAKEWIAKHYDLETNPGMGQQGLYYYYHVFAKALDANGERHLIDSDGVGHNWRAELIESLKSKQLSDGSWTNEADRWFEGDPNLVTAYCLLALEYCEPSKDQ